MTIRVTMIRKDEEAPLGTFDYAAAPRVGEHLHYTGNFATWVVLQVFQSPVGDERPQYQVLVEPILV
ncbi:MAG TPA: hypothetical protein VFZ91_13595 [Allosphingosinicella sp.]